MEFLAELLKGVILAVGVIVGLFICVAFIFRKINTGSLYTPEDLIKAFENYLQEIKSDEKYEQILIVDWIIHQLMSGTVPDEVNKYQIKEDSCLLMKEVDGNMSIKIHRTYKVIGLKPSIIAV